METNTLLSSTGSHRNAIASQMATSIYMSEPERPSLPARVRRENRDLSSIPAPSGKYKNFVEYIERAIEIAGNGHNLGLLMGFTSGTRVTDWKLGRGGRPSVSSVLRMAKLTGDDIIDVLVMTGYDTEAEILKGWADKRRGDITEAAKFAAQQPILQMLEGRALLDAAIKSMKAIGNIEE